MIPNQTTKVGNYEYLHPILENIPDEIKNLPRWVTWSAILSDMVNDKPRKVLFDPKLPNTFGKSNDPDTWGSYEQAVTSYEEGERIGIGFVLNGDGIVGVDLDDCVQDGEPNQAATELLTQLEPSYIEISPSGNGIRALGIANPLLKGINGKYNGLKVELYSNGRYLTITGRVIYNNGIKPMNGFNEFAEKMNQIKNGDKITPNLSEDTPLDTSKFYITENRNNHLFNYASKLKRIIPSNDEVFKAVLAENARSCRPPLSESEIRNTLMKTVSRYTPIDIDGQISPEQQMVNDWERRIHPINGVLSAPDWLVDGFIAEGLNIFAGSPGAGKTTCIFPLIALVASFSNDCEIKVKIRRKVIWVTEDTNQLDRLIFGIISKYSPSISVEEVREWITIIHSHRSKPLELAALAEFAVKYIHNGIEPLVVLDTASACIDLENENDNAEVGKYVATIKENFLRKFISVVVIAHTPKAIVRNDFANMTTRGASAWEGDANAIGYLFNDEDIDKRVLKLGKHRYEAAFDEVLFNTDTHTHMGMNRRGMNEEITYRVALPEISSKADRLEKAVEVAQHTENTKTSIRNILNSDKKKKLLSIIDEMDYPTIKSISELGLIGLTNRATLKSLLNEMILDGNIHLINKFHTKGNQDVLCYATICTP